MTNSRTKRGRGRPQRLPEEHQALTEREFDPRPRTAWLLAVNRLYAPEMADVSRAEFVARMREHGLAVDGPRVSRWESGQGAVPERVVSAYAKVTGRPPEALHRVVRLMEPSSEPTPVAEGREGAGSLEQEQLDRLFRRIADGTASGADWCALADDLARFRRVYLHADTWAGIGDQLVAELTASSGDAFLARLEAASALMADRRSRGHLTMAVGRFVTARGVQNVVPALWLLGTSPDRGAVQLVHRLVTDPSPMLSHAAVQVAAEMLHRGAWASPGLLGGLVAHRLSGFKDPAHCVDVLDVAAHLPEADYTSALGAVTHPAARAALVGARKTHELLPGRVSSKVIEPIAVRAESSVGADHSDTDQMLRRLLREALFHVHWRRRLVAGVLLAQTPYAAGVADGLVELARGGDRTAATMAWFALRYFPSTASRSSLVDLALEQPHDDLVARGLVTAGLFPGGLDERRAEALASRVAAHPSDGVRHAALFVLGMAGRAQHLGSGPLGHHDDVEAATTWWEDVGPLLVEAAG